MEMKSTFAIVFMLVGSVACVRPTQQIRRDRLIRGYFEKGYSNNLILCFLVALHGVHISLSTLKRYLRRQRLRRRGVYSDIQYVGDCLLV